MPETLTAELVRAGFSDRSEQMRFTVAEWLLQLHGVTLFYSRRADTRGDIVKDADSAGKRAVSAEKPAGGDMPRHRPEWLTISRVDSWCCRPSRRLPAVATLIS